MFFGQQLFARRDCGTGIFSLQDFCDKTMQVKDRAIMGQPITIFLPRVSLGDQPFAKEPEGSGYEIVQQAHGAKMGKVFANLSLLLNTT